MIYVWGYFSFNKPLSKTANTTCWIYIESDIFQIYRFIIVEGRLCHGPLARYEKLRFAHAPGMPGTFSPPPQVGDPDMHHGTCVTHVPWCMSGSLTSGFLWNRWRGKTFPAFPAHAQPAILRIWQEAHCNLHGTLSIFFSKYSQQTPHSSPISVSYGVHFVSSK